MTNRIYNLVAILALNIFVVLCGFLPIAQYQGQMYTVFSLPINTWYGIVYKLLVLLAIYGLFHAISQVGSVLYNEAYTSTADLVIALVGFFALFYKTQQYGIIYNNNFYVLMSFLSVGLLFEAGFAGKIDRENKYISNLLSRAMAEIAAKKENTENSYEEIKQTQKPLKELDHEEWETLKQFFTIPENYINSLYASVRAAKSYRTMTYTILSATLLYTIPVHFVKNVPITLFMIPDTYAQIASKLILIALALSGSLLFVPSHKIWSNIVRIFNIAMYIYTEFVLIYSINFYGFNGYLLFLIIFFFFAIKESIFE